MALLVPEITSAVFIPWGISLGVNTWELINSSGLVYVPFIVALVSSFFDARVADAADGSAAAMSLKGIERKFISMFAVLILFVFPWDSAGGEVRHNQYSCHSKGMSVVNGNAPIADLVPNSSAYAGLPPPKLSLLMGLVNNLSVGFANSMISGSGCMADLNTLVTASKAGSLQVQDERLANAIELFNGECFQPAIDRLVEAEGKGTRPNNAQSLTEPGLHFNSNVFKSAYNGTHQVGVTEKALDLTARKTELKAAGLDGLAIPSAFDWVFEKLTINCQDAAEQIEEKIRDYVDDTIPEVVEGLGKRASMFSTGTGDDYTQSVAWTELIANTYLQTANKAALFYDPDAAFAQAIDNNHENTLKRMIGIAGEGAMVLWQGFSKTVNLAVTVPMMYLGVGLFIALIYSFYPLLMLLSGFKADAALKIAYMIFVLIMMYFWLEVGQFASDVILSLAFNNLASPDSTNSTYWEARYMDLLPSVFMLAIPTIWIMLCGFIGIAFLLPVLGVATKTGQRAEQTAAQAAKMAAKMATKIIMRK